MKDKLKDVLKEVKDSKQISKRSFVVKYLTLKTLFDIDTYTNLFDTKKKNNICIFLKAKNGDIKITFKHLSEIKADKQDEENTEILLKVLNKNKNKIKFKKKLNGTYLYLSQVITDKPIILDSSYFEINKAGELELRLSYHG